MINEKVMNAIEKYMLTILSMNMRGLITDEESAGSISGYMKALLDMNLITQEEKTQLYEEFYKVKLK